jgi:hypothetical protein
VNHISGDSRVRISLPPGRFKFTALIACFHLVYKDLLAGEIYAGFVKWNVCEGSCVSAQALLPRLKFVVKLVRCDVIEVMSNLL